MKNIWKFIFSRRFAIYIAGVIILAFGITLNTKTGLGVSPIISAAYTVSVISGIRLGIVVFLWYFIMVALQAILLGKGFKPYQWLQIAASILTSWIIDFFDLLLPQAADPLWIRLLLLCCAVIATATGAVLTISMHIIPNPADGLADVLGKKTGKGLGFGKNLFDFSSIAIAAAIGFIFTGSFIGIGFGTLFTMIFTGRAIAVISKFSTEYFQKMIGSISSEEPVQ